MPTDECPVCRRPVPAPDGPGRPARYCSSACRQRAYRARRDAWAGPGADAAAPSGKQQVPHLTEQELQAWRGMLEVQSNALARLDAEMRERAGLSISEFDVLCRLRGASGRRRRLSDLAREATPPGGVRVLMSLVGRLAQRRLVTRLADEAVLTDKGERVLRFAADVHFAGVKALFIARLSEDEVEQLAGLWARLGPDARR
ncbi:hypothetical protein [Catenulispora rubra]|uniref:hypothetical protein n=1 Tax=Catenulispora rubra TaxID=280293 RepID=UPI00189253F2|nr:hypothetical protein [Catenulispora rubra]